MDIEEATRSLGICQASLLRATRMLERNVGKPLIGRDADGPTLNFAGTEFARRMRLALQEIEAGKREMDLERGQARSRITIGAMPLGGSVLIASVLDTFLKKYPEVEVKVVMESSSELIRSLRAGSVEFVVGLVPEKSDPELTTESLAETPFKIVGRAGHPLCNKAEITIDDLQQYEWIIGTGGSSRRECFERMFEGTAVPKVAIRTSSFAIFKTLLKSSDRLVLLTDYELMNESDAMRELPFKPSAPTPSIGITSRADWIPIQLQARLLDEIRRCTLGVIDEAA
jgi:DNA-binding transcriptional LysR family regulator